MEPEQAEMLKEEILVAAPLGRDGAGNVTSYDSPKAYSCRIQLEVEWVRASVGYDLVKVGKVYLDGDPGITDLCRITLPDGSHPPIAAVDTVADESGEVYYTVIMFRR